MLALAGLAGASMTIVAAGRNVKIYWNETRPAGR